jgi:Fungal Zn(2)-Cys(6) binuclear cluster domain
MVLNFTFHSSMQRGRNRPDPVSCQSCRSKKLRCNRVRPCSKCVARSIPCHFLVPKQRQTETTSTINSNAEILGRIELLESIVLQPVSVDTNSRYAADTDHLTRQLAPNPSSESAAVSSVHQSPDEDSQLLENAGTREDSLVCDPTLNVLQGLLPAHTLFSNK